MTITIKHPWSESDDAMSRCVWHLFVNVETADDGRGPFVDGYTLDSIECAVLYAARSDFGLRVPLGEWPVGEEQRRLKQIAEWMKANEADTIAALDRSFQMQWPAIQEDMAAREADRRAEALRESIGIGVMSAA